MNLSTLGISDQILRKVGNESDVLSSLFPPPFPHPSTVHPPPHLHLTDKEAGTSKFKQVGHDLKPESCGWMVTSFQL
jgi:hypothetical protein